MEKLVITAVMLMMANNVPKAQSAYATEKLREITVEKNNIRSDDYIVTDQLPSEKKTDNWVFSGIVAIPDGQPAGENVIFAAKDNSGNEMIKISYEEGTSRDAASFPVKTADGKTVHMQLPDVQSTVSESTSVVIEDMRISTKKKKLTLSINGVQVGTEERKVRASSSEFTPDKIVALKNIGGTFTHLAFVPEKLDTVAVPTYDLVDLLMEIHAENEFDYTESNVASAWKDNMDETTLECRADDECQIGLTAP